MKIEEIAELRKQIREILLNYGELKSKDSVLKKTSVDDLKQDAYVNIVDLKNKMDDASLDLGSESVIKMIDDTVKSLLNLKNYFSKSL
ncbi:MAG: hypothetical protein WC466_09625 [Candidatus Izemoplasmatales bacterium]